ncbi:undecaprenyldiphospho-muramoylpentapeptide beta-N-acetylglucosaminyltransferase [Marinimicrobium sp. ABcell2]|uniref:undecaprenyldiphospho-muramoylpentapeptide beta-N-acetylglucosaminyltransferase n=1 Tax=Marinimicrobium sp. ABcell2 TaxID=3069751 RepID=UPI0027B5FA89|nr:undecaprenyldiphospho-muramoylpentapeptide beta-N-acetylglucosaminyltransferase [Marinimicrobium sp. ABcell2]MDQ2075087.1 undecaprenyldiphospho-muramoylpentapeptide beta-N-acetylglucosaminyltransferase [Marinimicrobium sp. ABcell2]
MMSPTSLHIMIMAGGTGGHVFPALAVARVLQAQGAQVSWLGSPRGIEVRVVPEAGFPLFVLPVQGVRGRGILGLLKAPGLIALALWRAVRVMRETRPDLVIGFGGFASGPGGVAARLLRKPLVIHEQNAVAGTTNRLLARLATRVLTAFPDVLKNAEVVGNPVRQEIASLPAPTQRFENRSGPLRLLVLGGSLGARFINELLPEALASLAEEQRPQVRHQVGRGHGESTMALYSQKGVQADVHEFIDDMADAYAWADLVICRAGALTVSELMNVGVAAILIPFPHAIDDHQTQNARHLVDVGAAHSIAQAELTVERLVALLTEQFNTREKLLSMAQKGRQLAQPNAAEHVVQHCLEFVRG